MSEEARLFLREINGQLCISLYGSDGAGNLDSLRTDVSQILRMREFEPHEWVLPIELAVGGGTIVIYTVPAGTNAVVEIHLANQSGVGTANPTLYIVENGGVAALNRIVFGGALGPGAIDRIGPFVVHPGGTVRGIGGGAGTNCNVFVYAKEFSTGDPV